VKLDAIKRSLIALIEEAFPNDKFGAFYEFIVTAQDGSSMDAEPAPSALSIEPGLKPVFGVRMRPSILGEVATYPSGASVVIAFLNRDPARPFVAFGDPDSIPTTSTIDATAGVTIGHGLALPIARQTDPVQAGPFAGVIVQGSPLNTSG
jgi:hypothetical protein